MRLNLKIIRNYFIKYLVQPYQNYFVIPPYTEKHKILRDYAAAHNLKNFCETGTLLGETIEALQPDFEKLFSIELSEDLAKRAQLKFEKFNNVRIFQGDSGVVLQRVLSEIEEPCLFWLDGHYSSEFMYNDELIVTARGERNTPIFDELKSILTHSVKNHVILIDDARCFGVMADYPKISELKDFVHRYNQQLEMTVKRDIIRIFNRHTETKI